MILVSLQDARRLVRPVPYLVRRVLLGRAPCQVTQPAVAAVPVQVPRVVVRLRPRAAKRVEYQACHAPLGAVRGDAHVALVVRALTQDARLVAEVFTAPALPPRAHASLAAHLVAFELRSGPTFHGGRFIA